MGETGRGDETVAVKFRLLLPGHSVYDYIGKDPIHNELGKVKYPCNRPWRPIGL
jgi:hypothetical protein